MGLGGGASAPLELREFWPAGCLKIEDLEWIWMDFAVLTGMEWSSRLACFQFLGSGRQYTEVFGLISLSCSVFDRLPKEKASFMVMVYFGFV